MGRTYTSSAPAGFDFGKPAKPKSSPEVKNTKTKVTVQGRPNPPPNLSLPTAQRGIIVPYIAGTQRIFSPNVMWYGGLTNRIKVTKESDFETTTETLADGTVINNTEETITTTREIIGYLLDMQLGLCLGPGVRLRKIYEDNVLVWSGTAGPLRTEIAIDTTKTKYLTGGVVFQGGNYDQAQDPYLLSKINGPVPAYVGTAYIILKAVDITAGFAGQLSFEVDRFPNPLELIPAYNMSPDGLDLNVASLITDIAVSEWGGSGLSLTTIDNASFEAAAVTLAAEDNWASIYIQQEQQAIDSIDVLQKQARAILINDPSSAKMLLRLIREANYGNLDHVFDKTNVAQVRDVNKISWEGVTNQLRGTYTDRATNYGEGAVVAQNLASLSSSGKKKKSHAVDYPTVMNNALAVTLLSRDLADISIPTSSATIQTNRDGADKIPGDGLLFTWPEYGYNLEPMMVTRRRDLGKEANSVVLHLQQINRPKGQALFTPGEEESLEELDTTAKMPIDIVALSAPAFIVKKKGLQIDPRSDGGRAWPLFLTAPFDGPQAGFDLYEFDRPGWTVARVRFIRAAPYASFGRLDHDIGQFEALESGIIPQVTIRNVVKDSWLEEALSDTLIREGSSLVWINDEILSYESAVNAGSPAGTWVLNNVHRGLVDTAARAHQEDDRVFVIGNDWRFVSGTPYVVPSSFIPKWLLTPYTLTEPPNILSGFSPSITDPWVPDDRAMVPVRPHDTRVNYDREGLAFETGDSLTVTWATRSRQSSVIALKEDAPEAGERDAQGDYQVHRVMVRDADGDEYDLGVTANTADANELTVLFPVVAYGPGVLWVQAETALGVSKFNDELPFIYFGGADIVPEGTENGDYIVLEGSNTPIILEN